MMGALWTRGSVNLFTCAVYHNSETKTFVFGTDCKGKDKFSTGLFIDSLYHNHILPDKDVAEGIIWSDGPSSEFKKQFICFLLQKLSSVYKKDFHGSFLPHLFKKRVVDEKVGNDVVDGVGGRVKSNVHTKVMSLGRDRIIVQDARSFCQLASRLCDKTTMIHVMADKIDTYKSEDPFANSVPIKGISQMHVISWNGETKHLWLNSKHEKSDNKTQISLGNTSAASLVAEVATLTKDTKFSYYDVVKVVRSNFIGFYAIVKEPSDKQNE